MTRRDLVDDEDRPAPGDYRQAGETHDGYVRRILDTTRRRLGIDPEAHANARSDEPPTREKT